MLGSLGASLWRQWRDYESVDSRASIQETGADVDGESVVPTIFNSQSKGKRDRDQNVVRSLKDRKSPKTRERKVDSAIRGESMAQQKLYEGEAEVEARIWQKRNSDIRFSRDQLRV